jgi:hypothetical protein
MGEHPYMDAYDVYQRIIAGDTREANDRMRVGTYLEPHVLRMLRWQGLRARSCHRAYIHPILPLSASPDASAAPQRGYGHGLVEVKVSGAWTAVPGWIRLQAMAQLLLTGREVCWVACLTGSRLVVEPVERDWGTFADIEDAVASFTASHLQPMIAPQRSPYIFTAASVANGDQE